MKPWTRTAVAAAATAAALSATALPGQAATIGATSLRIPLSGSVLTSAGALDLTGTVHLVIYPNDPYHPGDPYAPNDPYRVQTNLVNVSATSPTLSCRATGSQEFEVSGLDSVFTAGYRLYPLDPYHPGDPYEPGTCGGLDQLSLRYEITFTEDGTIDEVEIRSVEAPAN